MIFLLDWRPLAAALMASLSFAAPAAPSGVGINRPGRHCPWFLSRIKVRRPCRRVTFRVGQTTRCISAPVNPSSVAFERRRRGYPHAPGGSGP